MITPMTPMREVDFETVILALKNSVLPPSAQVAAVRFQDDTVDVMLAGGAENGMKFELETGYDFDNEKFILTLKVKAPRAEDLI